MQKGYSERRSLSLLDRSYLFEDDGESEGVSWGGGGSGGGRLGGLDQGGRVRGWLRGWRRCSSGHMLVGRMLPFGGSQLAGSAAAQGGVGAVGIQRALHGHGAALSVPPHSIR